MSDTETKFYIILIFKPFALLLLQKTPTVVHSQKDVKQFKQDDFSSWRIIDSKMLVFLGKEQNFNPICLTKH